jgi:NADH-quinone oxidoreductase subunit C
MALIKEIESINKNFREEIIETEIKSAKRATVTINKDALIKAADFLFNKLKLRFIIASALHTKKGFEIYYHFSNDLTGLVINLHVILPKQKPEIKTLTSLFEAANWIEREMHEILGINFTGHPNLEKLISEGNWAKGVYPYRHDDL